MVECPRCDSEVGELHFLPPEVITRDLLRALGVDDVAAGEPEACGECIHILMEA